MTSSESVDLDPRPVLLEVRDAVVHYGRIQALHGVSLVVREGELVTLLGRRQRPWTADGASASRVSFRPYCP